MRRRTVLAGALAGAATFAVARAPARAARFSWKFASALTADNPLSVRSVEAFANIRRDTNGEFEITPYLNSMLGSTTAVVEQLRLGAIEMVITSGSPLDGFVPVASIPTIAFAFSDQAATFRAMDGDLGAYIRAEFPAHGFFALERAWDGGFRNFTTSTKPIRRAEDLEGLKLRVSPGKLFADTFRSLGCSTSAFGSGEIYTALQTHVVDGQETPLPTIEAQRIYEVQKYCSISNHIWTDTWFFINNEKWASLPSNFQEIARKHINAGAVLERRDYHLLDIALRDKLQRQGLTLNNVDVASLKAKLVASGYYGRWSKEYGAKAWSVLEKYSGRLA